MKKRIIRRIKVSLLVVVLISQLIFGSYMNVGSSYMVNAAYDVYTEQTNNVIGADFTGIDMPKANPAYKGFIAPYNQDEIPAGAIHIKTAQELATIGRENSKGKYYVLDNDINLVDEWIPINNFAGTLDGRGYSINNLYILENSQRKSAGLFGSTKDYGSDVIIKNLSVNIGTQGIVAYLGDGCDIYAGGLVGYSDSSINIINCYTTGKITVNTTISASSAFGGGLIGYNNGSINIVNCYTTGKITVNTISGFSGASAGGLIGYSDDIMNGIISITNCYTTGEIIANTTSAHLFGGNFDASAGGLIGESDSHSNGNFSITNCYTTGKVTATSQHGSTYAGGLIAKNMSYRNSNCSITNCYTIGEITANSTNYSADAGGLIGMSMELTDPAFTVIANCYTAGNIMAISGRSLTYANAGGLIGYFDGTLTIKPYCSYPSNLPRIGKQSNSVTIIDLENELGENGVDKSSISFNQQTVECKTNETTSITATLIPAYGITGEDVTWTSSDENILKIESSSYINSTFTNEILVIAKIRGVLVGRATVTVTTKDGVSSSYVVQVYDSTDIQEGLIIDIECDTEIIYENGKFLTEEVPITIKVKNSSLTPETLTDIGVLISPYVGTLNDKFYIIPSLDPGSIDQHEVTIYLSNFSETEYEPLILVYARTDTNKYTEIKKYELNINMDKWKFENFSEKIPLEYYQYIWTERISKQLYKSPFYGERGLCYGLTAVNALIKDQPNLMYFVDIANNSVDYLSELSQKSLSNYKSEYLSNLSIKEYIYIMHLSQLHPMHEEQQDKNIEEYQEIYDKVSNYERTGSNPILIVFMDRHTLFPIRVEEGKDGLSSYIYVYDSNHPYRNTYITLKRNSKGEYSSWEYMQYNDNSDKMTYCDIIINDEFYQLLYTPALKELNDWVILATTNDNFSIMDTSGNIASFRDGKLSDSKINIIELNGEISNLSTSTTNNAEKMMYLPYGQYIIKGSDDKKTTTNMTSDYRTTEVIVSANSKITMSISDKNINENYVYIDFTSQNNEFEILYDHDQQVKNLYESISLRGISDNRVETKETTTGIVISGIESVIISVNSAGDKVTKAIQNADKYKSISVSVKMENDGKYLMIMGDSDNSGNYRELIDKVAFTQGSSNIEIRATAGTGGTVTGGGTYNQDATITLLATPNKNYIFNGWYVNNNKVSSAVEYIFKATENCTIEARFTYVGGTSGNTSGNSSSTGSSGSSGNNGNESTSNNTLSNKPFKSEESISVIKKEDGFQKMIINPRIEVSSSDKTDVVNLIASISNTNFKKYLSDSINEITIKLPKDTMVSFVKSLSKETKSIAVTIDIPQSIASYGNVTLNEFVLSKEVYEAVQDVGLTLSVTMQTSGKKGYSWGFDSSIHSSERTNSSVNMTIDMLQINSLSKEYSNLREILKNDEKNMKDSKLQGMLLTLHHEGLLPSTAQVSIYATGNPVLTGIQSGHTVYLYYYNKTANRLEEIPNNQYVVDKKGYIDIHITHCSDYVLLPNKLSTAVSLLDQVTVTPNGKTLYVASITETQASIQGNSVVILTTFPDHLKKVNSFSTVNNDKGVSEVKITYRSSDPSIATVSGNGKVVAKKTGKATITVTVQLADGSSKQFKVKITVKHPSVTVINSAETMLLGDKKTFKIKVVGYKQTDITWGTTKKQIALVSQNKGKLSATVTAETIGTDYVVIYVKGVKVFESKVTVEK